MKRAVFLDKDGTLIENVPYNIDPDRIRLMPGAIEALRALHRENFVLIVISNQPGVAHGYFDEVALDRVSRRLRGIFDSAGIPIRDFFYCPHHPAGTVPGYRQSCDCRKPRPGLLLQAAERHDINLAESWFIGDILDDMEAGRRAGCRTVLVDTGNETEWRLSPHRIPDVNVFSLEEAAKRICADGLDGLPPGPPQSGEAVDLAQVRNRGLDHAR